MKTRQPRDAAAVVFGLKFADNVHYKFKGQASKARLQSSKRTGAGIFGALKPGFRSMAALKLIVNIVGEL